MLSSRHCSFRRRMLLVTFIAYSEIIEITP
jgi:hypothetical protein